MHLTCSIFCRYFQGLPKYVLFTVVGGDAPSRELATSNLGMFLWPLRLAYDVVLSSFS